MSQALTYEQFRERLDTDKDFRRHLARAARAGTLTEAEEIHLLTASEAFGLSAPYPRVIVAAARATRATRGAPEEPDAFTRRVRGVVIDMLDFFDFPQSVRAELLDALRTLDDIDSTTAYAKKKEPVCH